MNLLPHLSSRWLARTTFVSAATASSTALAQQGSGYYHGHMWEGGWMGWILGPMMMILFIALIVIGVVVVTRWLNNGDRRDGDTARSPDKSPIAILEERFARGEIDKEEFEERRRTLEG